MEKNSLVKFISDWIWFILIVFLLAGWRYPVIGVIAVTCMLAPVIMASWKGGRIWCGSFCPRGSFNDNIVNKVSRRVKIPEFIKTKLFRGAVFLFLMVNFGVGIINAGNLREIGLVFYRIIFVTTGVAIFLGVIFKERIWCAFCPIGTLSMTVVKLKRKLGFENKRIKVDESVCINCNVCEEECPLDLEPYEFTGEKDKDLDCLHCGGCIEACPVDALLKEER